MTLAAQFDPDGINTLVAGEDSNVEPRVEWVGDVRLSVPHPCDARHARRTAADLDVLARAGGLGRRSGVQSPVTTPADRPPMDPRVL